MEFGLVLIPILRGAAVAAALAVAPVAMAADGLFARFDAGVLGESGVTLTRTNHGVPTNCDQWLGGHDFDGDGVDDVPLPASGCAPRALPSASNAVDIGGGYLGAVAVGYAVGRLRAEVEYTRQQRGGGTASLVVPGDPKQREFVRRDESARAVRADGIFANIHWDLRPGTWTPYVAAGLGAVLATIDYRATSIRTDDRQALIGLGRNPNASGTVSQAREALQDALPAYQAMVGMRRALRQDRWLNLQLRYTDALRDFTDKGNRWRQLRSHDSTVAPDGAPVRYDIGAQDFGAWSFTIGFGANLR